MLINNGYGFHTPTQQINELGKIYKCYAVTLSMFHLQLIFTYFSLKEHSTIKCLIFDLLEQGRCHTYMSWHLWNRFFIIETWSYLYFRRNSLQRFFSHSSVVLINSHTALHFSMLGEIQCLISLKHNLWEGKINKTSASMIEHAIPWEI